MADTESEAVCHYCKKDLKKENDLNRKRHIQHCKKRPPAGTTVLTRFFTAGTSSSKIRKLEQSVSTSTTPTIVNQESSGIICDVEGTQLRPDDSPPNSSAVNPDDNQSTTAASSATPEVSSQENPEVICVDMRTKPSQSQQPSDIQPLCSGYKIPGDQKFYMQYPFQLHEAEKLEFIPVNGKLYSTKCVNQNFQFYGPIFGTVCLNCQNLQYNQRLLQILRHAEADYEDVKYLQNSQLTFKQLVQRINEKQKTISRNTMQSLNLVRKTRHLTNQQFFHNKLLDVLANNDIPRVRQLVAVCMRQKRSITYIVDQLNKAVCGLYSPKGFSTKDFDIACLVLTIGGPRLLHLLHQTSGLPSLSHVYRIMYKHYDLHKFKLIAFYPDDLAVTLRENLTNATKDASFSAWSLKLDEIAVEKRLRWFDATNSIVGLCYNHSKEESVVFDSIHTVDNIVTHINEGSIHLATEALVVAVSSIADKHYQGRPCLIIPVCDHKTPEAQALIFQTVIESWSKEKGLLLNIGTDGDGVRRKVLHNLLSFDLEVENQLYPELSELKYLDLTTGPESVTINFDPKHLLKRFRNNLLSVGITIDGVTVNSILLRPLLSQLGCKETEIETMLNPLDRQNVPLAVKLVTKLAEYDKWDTEKLSPGMKQILPAMKAMKVMCDGLLAFFARPHLSIEDILKDASALSHILFILYRHNHKLMPNVLFHDLQCTIHDVYFSAAKFKIHFPDNNFLVYQLGSDQVEQLFASVRTQTNDRACDTLQLQNRLQSAEVMDKVYSSHPEWRPKKGRLIGPVDHSAPSDWSGNQACGELNFITLWNSGSMSANSALPKRLVDEVQLQLDKAAANKDAKKVTMQKPFGQIVGVREDESTDTCTTISELSDKNDNEANEEAIVEFEDAMSTQTNVSPTIMIEGKPHFKASLLRILSQEAGCLKSGDRLRRVQGLSKFPSAGCRLEAEVTKDDTIIVTVKDVVIAAVESKQGVSAICMCVISVDGLIDNRKCKQSFMQMNQPGTVVGSILQIESDCGDKYTWKTGMERCSVKVAMKHCSLITPDVVLDEDCKSVCLEFQHSELENAFMSMDVPAKLPSISHKILPYRNSQGSPIFFKPSSSDSVSIHRPLSGGFNCHCCNKQITKISPRVHIGGHILRGQLSDDVCGFCGKHGCSIDLKKSQKTFIPVSNCSHFEKFSLKPAEISRDRSPCTNRPIRCKICDVVYWSYHLMNHFKNKHSDSVCPDLISDDERKRMDKV